jgi:hypothetical protein
MPQQGTFVWNGHSAVLHYAEQNRLYSLLPMDGEGAEFLSRIHVDYEIELHTDAGQVVKMTVITTEPNYVAKAL